jgi:DNA-binding NarL/FixJ family response regulator
MSNQISIMIVDDHTMVRTTFRDRLELEPDMSVVACVGSADEAVAQAARLVPDIVLMDIDMPGMLCFDAAKTICLRDSSIRIIFLSAFYHDRYIEQALEVRAWGYVTKNETEQSLIEAVRRVASGVTYFSPDVQSRIVVDARGPRLAHAGYSRTSTLTHREMEVLRYLARGMSKKEIGKTVHISVNTVNRHASSLMNKLDIHDRVELARFAIREGLAEP